MAVVEIRPKGNTLQFIHDGSPEGQEIADYVCNLVKEAKRLGTSRGAVVAKAALGDAVLTARRLQSEKAGLLEKQAEQWERKAQDGTYTLAKEVRDYMRDKAKTAREEAGKIREELG